MAIPKYEQVKGYLTKYIEQHQLKYGDGIPTEAELMNELDVSRHTIRRAVSDLINQGWLFTQQGSGTYVANPKADENIQGKMIGVVTTYFKDYIFPEILAGIDDVVSEKGYSLLLGTTKNNAIRERVVLNNMLNNQLAGLIVEPSKSVYPNANIDLFQKFRDRGIPVLFIHASYRDFEASSVVEDDEMAGFLATKHLLELGHKNIIAIFKQDDMQGHGRYKGYLNAYEVMGVELNPNLVKWFNTENQGEVVSVEALRMWLSSGLKSTAFICYNDMIAMQLLNNFNSMGIQVPRDYSVVSFDNSHLISNLDVGITSVAHPKGRLGEKAGETIIGLIENPSKLLKEVMAPEMIVRHSTRHL